jgi:hypothetical protein
MVSVVTMPWAAKSMVQVETKARNFSLLPNIQTGSTGAHPASYPMGTRILPHGSSWWGMKLNNHFHLGPRLRMSRAVPLLPTICLHGMHRDYFTCPRELSTVLLKLEVSVRFPPQYRPPSPISSGSLDTHTQYTSLPQDNATPRTRYTISEEKSHKFHRYTTGSVMLLI